ncbi:MAG: ABC transporter permease [Mycobacteriales bacterium]
MRFVLRRAGFFLLTLWSAMTLNFVIPRLMPGDPAEAIFARYKGRVSPTVVKALEAQFGIHNNKNIVLQYFDYLANTLRGRFGISTYYFPNPVSKEIATALPWTVMLVGITTLLAFLLGTLIGTVSAWRRGGALDSILPPVFVVTSAIPYFWVAMVFVLVFAVSLSWFPTAFGYTPGITIEPSMHFFLNAIDHAILPAVTILITSIGGWILTMRNNMITTLAEDYVRMGRAKGLTSRRVMFDYAARNAILPNLTGFAMSMGFVISGAILVEYVFSYPGIGFMLLQAVSGEDFPLMQALFLLITVAVLVAVLLADIVTALLDPRTRQNA